MSLLVDKWRPKNLDDLHYHKDLSERLRALVSPPSLSLSSHCSGADQRRRDSPRPQAQTDFPHTLFYGPSGAGKKTRIMCTLRELFGPGVEKVSDGQQGRGTTRLLVKWERQGGQRELQGHGSLQRYSRQGSSGR